MSSISPNRLEEVSGNTPITRYCLTEKENSITLPRGRGTVYCLRLRYLNYFLAGRPRFREMPSSFRSSLTLLTERPNLFATSTLAGS